MQKVSEAVLGKVREEAREIVAGAEHEAERELEAARDRRTARESAARRQRLAQADSEAARIVSQGRMQARNTVAAAKAEVMAEIMARAAERLKEFSPTGATLGALLAEAIDAIGDEERLVVGVAQQDLELAREIIKDDEELAARIAQVVERPIDGGVQVAHENGAIMVDNTYATRLAMLAPRVRARFGAELF